MSNGASSTPTPGKGSVQKRYELKFIPGGPPDHLEWEDTDVTARVRKPGSLDLVPIKKVVKLEDDSQHVLQLPEVDALPPGMNDVRFKVGINKSALDQLKAKLTPDPQAPVYRIDLEVEADPTMQAALGAALQFAAPGGIGTALASGMQTVTQIKGASEVTVEFPHPFIWHSLMDERFSYSGTQPTEIDTDSETGRLLKLHLKEFSPKGGGGYQPGQEKLEVNIDGDGLQLLKNVVPDQTGVTLKTSRVLIGKPSDVENPDNQVKITPTWTPPPGSIKKAARNQADINAHPPLFQYKAHTVDVAIEIYQNKPDKNEPVLLQTINKQTLNGESAMVRCSGLPKNFQGFLRWKITRKPQRYTDEHFHMGNDVTLLQKGSHFEATIELVRQACLTEATGIHLSVQVPLHLQDLRVQISKQGWQNPQPVSLSSANPQDAEFFAALEQGTATITVEVSHRLKEEYEGLTASDVVRYPEITVTGFTQSIGQVTYDTNGQATIQLGTEGTVGSSLDISDRLQPLEIDDSVLQPIKRLEDKGRSTAQLLTENPNARASNAKSIIKNGLKTFRSEYLKDYIELPGHGQASEDSIQTTAEPRKNACSCLALMMDACGKTPWLHSAFENSYSLAFRSAVSCCFATCIDTLLFFWSFATSGPLAKFSKAGEEVPEDLARRGIQELPGDGADETVRAGTEAAQEGTDQTARVGAEASQEGAEDLSKLSAKELQERLAAKKAEREAAEQALEELKKRHPNAAENKDALLKVSEIADESLEQAKQAKELVESELDELEKALEKSNRMQKVLKEAEGELDEAKKAYDSLKKQKDELPDMIDDAGQQAKHLEGQATRAQKAGQAAEKTKDELQKVVGEAERRAERLTRELDSVQKEIDTLTDDMGGMLDPGEIEGARKSLNGLNSLARRLQKTTIPNARKRLTSLKDRMRGVVEEISTQNKAYEDALSSIGKNKKRLADLKKNLKEVTDELQSSQGTYHRARHSFDAVQNETAKLETPSELVLKKRPLTQKLKEMTEDVVKKTDIAKVKKEKAREALTVVHEIRKKQHDAAVRLPAEEAELSKALDLAPKMGDLLPPALSETIKAEVDKDHWLRQAGWNTLIAIPGIGQLILAWKALPYALKLMAMVTERIMRCIGWVLDNCDTEVKEFSKSLETVLGKYRINVNVQPVYGCKGDWVVKYMPRPQDKFLDPVPRAQVAQDGTKAVSKEARKNRQTLKQQAMNNALAGLTDAFDVAHTYKNTDQQVYFTQKAYEQAKNHITGADQTLSRLLEQEADSKIRADALYGWNPLTVGFTTWNDYVRIIDWMGFIIAWVMRIAAVVGGVSSAATVIGPLTAAGVFLAADGVDVLKNGIKTLIALGGDANTKAKFLQLAVNYPCLAQGWLFKGMAEYTPQDLEAVNTWDGLTKCGPPPGATDLTDGVKRTESRFKSTVEPRFNSNMGPTFNPDRLE